MRFDSISDAELRFQYNSIQVINYTWHIFITETVGRPVQVYSIPYYYYTGIIIEM